jgi:YesN/AraC family two-component response regulator
MVYDAVIIDDEPWSIIDIQKTFPFEELGFRVAGTYLDSRKAMQALVESPVHLVVTDICMPNLGGLELIEYLRQQGLPCEVIIMSGYNNFTYAKRAIRQGVFGYCLKPTDTLEVKSLLIDLKKKLDATYGHTNKLPPGMEKPLTAFEELLAYMRVHYNEKITLDGLAKRFSLNPNYCCSLFSQSVGTTFSRYLTDLRIDRARSALTQSGTRVEDIARQVGFSDAFYFSKVFKKQCGLSPREYRQQLLMKTLPRE